MTNLMYHHISDNGVHMIGLMKPGGGPQGQDICMHIFTVRADGSTRPSSDIWFDTMVDFKKLTNLIKHIEDAKL